MAVAVMRGYWNPVNPPLDGIDENENVVSSESCDRVLSNGTLAVVAGAYFVFRFGKGRVALGVEVDVTAVNDFLAREGSDATLRPS